MGNKLGRRRQVVDEKYTRPQGLLYQDRDVDHKKLRRLILDSKLAPCYPGDDDSRYDLEECPICFLYYPSLNRSRCCLKGICTECFLQMKTPNSTRPTQCPFCKTSNYAVEYRGVKTKEEKSSEQLEEQRVIEAKIRMRQQEIREEGERMLKKQGEIEYSENTIGPAEADRCATQEIIASHEGDTSTRPSPRRRQNREDELDLDLEDIMVMEAIWLSIQETGRCPAHPSLHALRTEECITDDYSPSATMGPVTQPSSPSGGLACAIAALPECHQTMSIETPDNSPSHMPVYSTGPGCSGYAAGREAEDYYPTESGTGGDDDGDWAETSYVGSGEFDDVANPLGRGPHDENRCGPRPTGAPITPLFHFAARDIFFNRPPT